MRHTLHPDRVFLLNKRAAKVVKFMSEDDQEKDCIIMIITATFRAHQLSLLKMHDPKNSSCRGVGECWSTLIGDDQE